MTPRKCTLTMYVYKYIVCLFLQISSRKYDTYLPIHHFPNHSHIKSLFEIKSIRASASNDGLMKIV